MEGTRGGRGGAVSSTYVLRVCQFVYVLLVHNRICDDMPVKSCEYDVNESVIEQTHVFHLYFGVSSDRQEMACHELIYSGRRA